VNRLLFLTSFTQYGEGAFVELVMEGLAPTVERATKETTVRRCAIRSEGMPGIRRKRFTNHYTGVRTYSTLRVEDI